MSGKVRSVIGTLYKENLNEGFLKELFDKTEAKFASGQIEECPSTKKLHLQFVLQFKNPRALSALGTLCGCHIEPCKDLKESISYCRKVETRIEGPWTFGEEPTIGGRPKMAKEFLALTLEQRLELPMHQVI